MGKYQAYEKYKDSGVEWLGDIPEHWQQKRIKFSVDLINKKVEAESSDLPYIGLEHIESWTGKRIEDENASSEGIGSHFLPNDVLFGKLRPYLAKVYLSELEGLSSTEALVLRSQKDINSRFFKYYILSRDFINIVDSSTFGSKMPRASWEFIGNLLLSIPPLDEQEQIAAFLDHKTKQIDDLIAKKEALLEKLDEKRTALISHAVTKGLDPTVPMKYSGVEWLGDIPEHWIKVNLRWLVKINSGDFISNLDTEVNKTNEAFIPVVGGNGIMSFTNKQNTKANSLIIGRVGAQCGNIHLFNEMTWVTDNALRIIIQSRLVHFLFLFWVLKLLNLNDFANKNAQPLITGEMVKNRAITLPSLDEQKLIVTFLDHKTAEIDLQKAKVREAIERLKEYRTALITNAVTGKIDVRQVSPN